MIEISVYLDDHEEMGTARTLYSPAEVKRRFRRVLLDQRQLFAPFCATAAKMFGRVHADPGPEVDWAVVSLLDAGIYVDLQDNGHCVTDLLAALPRLPYIDRLREGAYNECENPNHGHPRTKTGCLSVVKGLPTDPYH